MLKNIAIISALILATPALAGKDDDALAFALHKNITAGGSDPTHTSIFGFGDTLITVDHKDSQNIVTVWQIDKNHLPSVDWKSDCLILKQLKPAATAYMDLSTGKVSTSNTVCQK